ncbi:MAG: VWA domain-containing protein [Bryobacteraceae bacterium]
MIPFLAWMSLATLQDARFTAEARLVEAHATVLDHHGSFIDGLQREQFRILDNGEPQEILAFESGVESISCSIVIDTTGSVQNALPYVKNATMHLIDALRADDSVAIYGFNTSLRRLSDFTTDKALAKRSVQYLRAAGQTALFDAISEVSDAASRRKGKKAIIVFTDGADNASVLYKAAAESRSRQAGLPIYAIAEGDAQKDSNLRKILRILAEQTGGKSL